MVMLSATICIGSTTVFIRGGYFVRLILTGLFRNFIFIVVLLGHSFDLTKAQEQLYSAQQNYLQAMLDVINKRATLEKLLNKN